MIQGLKKSSQLQIGLDIWVELQIPPSVNMDFRGAEEILRLEGEGGHTEKSESGEVTIVAWDPGPKKSRDGAGSINLFNGVSNADIPTSSEFLDAWHIHTSKTQEIVQSDGTTRTFRGSMTPSGNPSGTDHNGDYGQARMLQSHGYNSTMIQVGTSSGNKINFYNGTGPITSMNFNSFRKLGK